jgi:16S rRNA (cytidine1402-2'-O)-methyltransferase
MLYIVATPIGNLRDVTLRAIEILKACKFVIAENPGHSQILLKQFDIQEKKIMQFAEFNEQEVLPNLIKLLEKEDACLITDAGTPTISDPGFRLVRECVKKGIGVSPIPGANAAVAALSASGLPTDKFIFLGFLGKTEFKVSEAIKEVRDIEATGIFYESPERIVKTISYIANAYPEANIVIARELTKIHEEFIRGTAKEVLENLSKRDSIKGEITVLISFKN